jgi:di/tricarboxylate transporter
VLLMLAVGFLGAFMSSTGVVAIFVPIVLRMASRSGIAPAQLMMPMAYAALISGMMTLVATSPNLVINYEVVRSGAEGFSFFSFTPFGVPILIVGTLYMLLASPLARRDAVAGRRRRAAAPGSAQPGGALCPGQPGVPGARASRTRRCSVGGSATWT